MFASFLLLFGGIFTAIIIILLVPDIPISFNDFLEFFAHVFVLILFPISLFAMVSPGTMSTVYNKAKNMFTKESQPTITRDNSNRSFNIYTVTIGFMSVFGFLVVYLMYMFNVKIKHEEIDSNNRRNRNRGKRRSCDTDR